MATSEAPLLVASSHTDPLLPSDKLEMNASTMVTPSIKEMEAKAILLISFNSDEATADLISCIKDRLIEGGLKVVAVESEDAVVLGVTTTERALLLEAQKIRLFKKRLDKGIMEAFRMKNKGQFTSPLFTHNDWALLCWRIFDDIDVLPKGQVTSNLSRKLDALKITYRNKLSKSAKDLIQPGDEDHPTQSLRYVLERAGIVQVVSSIHNNSLKEEIWKQTRGWSLLPPTQLIHEYYGDEVAFYFGWMGFLTQWLCFPGFLGTCALFYRLYRDESISNDEYTPFYGLITFIWGIIFLQFWARQEIQWSYQWGTLLNDYERQTYFAPRTEFTGKLRHSPVTGELEVYYPAYKRRLKYIVNGIVTIAMLGVAFTAMILSLNLQGYIDPKHDLERWGPGSHHPFHFEKLSRLADPGELFDANNSARALIPVAFHVATIFTLNQIYRVVAGRLTDWENHKARADHNNSLILKRFLFEAFDCYVALFYLAFFERNVDKLRSELISVFNIDTFRRLLLECLVPMVLQRITRKKKKSTNPLTTESELDEYDQFDDYMEIVIQYGYVTLFASAYPLASLIAILANLIEIRADCFKLTYLCRRPRSNRSNGLGMWKSLLSGITWLSALTNCLIFGFTSGQMREFLPEYYQNDESGHVRLIAGKGWIAVFIIFGAERLLVYSGLLIQAIVPDIPDTIMEELERTQFVHEEEANSLRDSLLTTEKKDQ
jgi:anoctamin-10